MQNCEAKKKKSTATTTTQAALPISTTPLFKPRQVLLNSISNSNMKNNNDLQIQNGTKSKTLISLTNQRRTLLLQSICQFLDQNGFSKSLKNFRKEADVEKESWKSCFLNLEEMCYQFLKTRNDTKVSDSSIKEIDEETIKGTKENDVDEGKKSKEKEENESVDVKKKKKKSKKTNVLSEQPAEGNTEDVSLSVPSEPEKKSNDKKKKKNKDDSQEKKESIQVKLDELPVEKTSEKADTVFQVEKKEKSKSRKKKEDIVEISEIDKEKKVSKKRKKSSSEEDDTGCVEKAAVDDSKRRKTDNLDQSNGTFLPKTPNGSANGVLENGETKSQKKDKSRQYNGSAEPRTSANAFRRVKEEEVEFVDEKLQDNSYWAKDGADSGYGAKAQEVLGQVRGRDFRHEKTKKKRGSYRGGQIDLHSHSFKFNYDDDEE